MMTHQQWLNDLIADLVWTLHAHTWGTNAEKLGGILSQLKKRGLLDPCRHAGWCSEAGTVHDERHSETDSPVFACRVAAPGLEMDC